MEKIRCFIAVELPQDVKDSLAASQSRLKRAGDGAVKWVAPEGIHLTLKFLGSVDAEKIQAITLAIAQAAKGTGTLKLATRGIGAFPSWQRVRVVWVGLEGDVDRLKILQERADEALKPLGFAPEARAFSPHLTLGRVRETVGSVERHKLGEALSAVNAEGSSDWTATELSLMRSELRPTGAIYSQLAAAGLEG